MNALEQSQLVANWAVVVNATAVLCTLPFLAYQLREMRKATSATAYSKALEILQCDATRKARAHVFSLKEKSYAEWTEDDQRAGEHVCHTYDQVGIMIQSGMFSKELVVDSAGDALRRLWPILKPMVTYYRARRDAEEFWDDFEWLAQHAIARKKSKKH